MLYLKIIDTISDRQFCVESKCNAANINLLNQETHIYDWYYIKYCLIHHDTSYALGNALSNRNLDKLYCEVMPNSCVKKLFGSIGWSFFKEFPTLANVR